VNECKPLIVEFREDLKTLFRQAGVSDKPTVFLFDETQIVVETFLEDINNVLTSGEVGRCRLSLSNTCCKRLDLCP
jgi:hypothetical protein